MVRYVLDSAIREKLFASALRKKSEQELSGLLGYQINRVYRVRQLRKGKVSLSREMVTTLAEIAGVPVESILVHSKKIYIPGPYADGRKNT